MNKGSSRDYGVIEPVACGPQTELANRIKAREKGGRTIVEWAKEWGISATKAGKRIIALSARGEASLVYGAGGRKGNLWCVEDIKGYRLTTLPSGCFDKVAWTNIRGINHTSLPYLVINGYMERIGTLKIRVGSKQPTNPVFYRLTPKGIAWCAKNRLARTYDRRQT